ncbi:MAG: MFS transporter [Pseudohongiellaceae bacterium]|nr:MFS transporter [Pseudohongiellaceae bacterium]
MPKIKDNTNNSILQLKQNKRVIYGLTFCRSFTLFLAVIVPFFESKGLSLSQIFYLQALFAGAVLVLEAPSGYLADRFGRKTLLVIGSIADGLGCFWLIFANGFVDLLIFEMLLAVAVSLMSGADLAILYDTEKALSESEETHTSSIAHLGFTKSVAEGFGALLGGALALWSFEIMILTQAIVAWSCLALSLLLIEPPNTDKETTPLDFKGIYNHVMKGDAMLKRVFFAIPIYNLSTFHVVWLVQSYWEEQGLSLIVFGALWFAQSITVAIASQCSFALEKYKGAAFALIIIGLLPIVGHFGMAWLGGWAGISICFVLFFCRGLYQVILTNALNRRIPGSVRATVNSLTSLTFRFGFILTGPLVGHLADTRGLSSALNLLGLSSIAIFVLIMLPLVKAVKELNKLSKAPILGSASKQSA